MDSFNSHLPDVSPTVRSQLVSVPPLTLCTLTEPEDERIAKHQACSKVAAIQALPFAMVLLNSEQRVCAVNDACGQQFAGMANSLGCSLPELWGQAAAQRVKQAMLQVARTGRAIAVPLQLEQVSGTACQVQVGVAVDPMECPSSSTEPTLKPVPEPPHLEVVEPNRCYYISLIPLNTGDDHPSVEQQPEITPGIAVKMPLAESEIAKLGTAFSIAPDGIAIFNRVGRLIYANDTLLMWWNHPTTSVIGKSYLDIELFQRWGTVWQMTFDHALTSGQQQTLETQPFTLENDQVLQTHILPEVGETGTVESLLVLFRDITTVKRAQRALVSQASREYTLRSISQHIRQSLNLDRILSSAVMGIQQALQADRVLIYRFSERRSAHIAWEVATSEYPVPFHLHQCHYPISEQCWALLQQSECTWIAPSPSELKTPFTNLSSSELPHAPTSLYQLTSLGDGQGMRIQSQIITVIIQRYPKHPPTIWGILAAQACSSPRTWQIDEAELLYEVAGQLAIGIQHAELIKRLNHQSQHLSNTNTALVRANAQLKELSELDGLTKIANRRRFDNTLVQEWQRLRRSQAPLSFILFDVDHFKRYNDTHGHPAGDQCLIQIARTASQQLGRPTDLLARYGGEEFIVLLPETDVRGAIIVAEAIRQAIWDLAIVNHYVEEKAVFVSVSLGVVSCIPSPDNEPTAVIDAADRALYQAKERGRNLWVCAN